MIVQDQPADFFREFDICAKCGRDLRSVGWCPHCGFDQTKPTVEQSASDGDK